MIKLALSPEEIAGCFHTMQQLRPELRADSFVALIQQLMRDGYQLAYLQDNDVPACVAGFRISTNLYLGKHLYVDDLATNEDARSAGHGQRMMAWLRQHAQDSGCRAIHLDSAVHRFRAHKFYLNQNMQIACHHFVEKFA